MNSIPQSSYKAMREKLAEMGRDIPLQLVRAIQEELFAKVTEWLRENGAPEEVLQAIENADYLHLVADYIQKGEFNDVITADWPETIIQSANLAVKFGGSFLNYNAGDSQIPAWVKKPAKKTH